MQFANVSDTDLWVGTSLIGEVTATRDHLEKVFGKPSVTGGEGDKVTVEWTIAFEDGSIATIYDWKRYEEGSPEWDEVYGWHVGGRTPKAIDLVKSAIERIR
jgi:hypothetical protein